jgi:hypothetical protein
MFALEVVPLLIDF